MQNIATPHPSPQVEKRQALPAGTKIDYSGMDAIVMEDKGGDQLKVSCEGHVQNWHWSFEGIECTVVSLPGAMVEAGNAAPSGTKT